MKQIRNFTQGGIFGPLMRFALPILAALFLQTMYGAVDLLVVGQFGSSVDVSAVSTGSQVMHTVTVVITGLSMGLTVLVGRKIGEGKSREAGDIVGSGIWLFGILAVILSVAMVIAAPAMSRVMHAPEEAFRETVGYVTICSAGAVFIVAYNLLGSIFRGIGDSVMPLVTVVIACVTNIAGDLLLVAAFGLGTAGAAIATVAAQALSVVLSLVIIVKRKLPFEVGRKSLRPRGEYIKETMRLGTPIALQDLLVSISFLVIMAIVNSLGLVASAGVGVAEKLCGFVMLVPSAYSQAMSAFVAQNMGARRPGRANRALFCGIASSLAVGVVMFYLNFFHGNIMAGLFARDGEVVLAAADYLRAYAVDCLLTSFLFCFVGYFNGCGSTLFVMIQGLVGAFGVRIPVSYFMSQIEGVSLFQIGIATPASSFVQIVMCGIYFMMLRKKHRQMMEENRCENLI